MLLLLYIKNMMRKKKNNLYFWWECYWWLSWCWCIKHQNRGVFSFINIYESYGMVERENNFKFVNNLTRKIFYPFVNCFLSPHVMWFLLLSIYYIVFCFAFLFFLFEFSFLFLDLVVFFRIFFCFDTTPKWE